MYALELAQQPQAAFHVPTPEGAVGQPGSERFGNLPVIPTVVAGQWLLMPAASSLSEMQAADAMRLVVRPQIIVVNDNERTPDDSKALLLPPKNPVLDTLTGRPRWLFVYGDLILLGLRENERYIVKFDLYMLREVNITERLDSVETVAFPSLPENQFPRDLRWFTQPSRDLLRVHGQDVDIYEPNRLNGEDDLIHVYRMQGHAR